MSEREGTPEDFARLFGAEPSEAEPTERRWWSHAAGGPACSYSDEDEDGSAFLRRLFEPKRGHVEFIRSIHGDGAA